jgi:hypothetical protein
MTIKCFAIRKALRANERARQCLVSPLAEKTIPEAVNNVRCRSSKRCMCQNGPTAPQFNCMVCINSEIDIKSELDPPLFPVLPSYTRWHTHVFSHALCCSHTHVYQSTSESCSTETAQPSIISETAQPSIISIFMIYVHDEQTSGKGAAHECMEPRESSRTQLTRHGATTLSGNSP